MQRAAKREIDSSEKLAKTVRIEFARKGDREKIKSGKSETTDSAADSTAPRSHFEVLVSGRPAQLRKDKAPGLSDKKILKDRRQVE